MPTMASTITQYDSLVRDHSFVFIVFFRGHWGPFCMSYLKHLQSIETAVAQAGGQICAVTAESESQLTNTRKASGFQGQILVDQQNALAKELKRRGLLDVAITDKSGYAHGMAQPAVLVVTGEEKVLYRWEIVPSMMNLGGAKDRPDVQSIWENVEAQLNGQPVKHTKISGFGISNMLSEMIFG